MKIKVSTMLIILAIIFIVFYSSFTSGSTELPGTAVFDESPHIYDDSGFTAIDFEPEPEQEQEQNIGYTALDDTVESQNLSGNVRPDNIKFNTVTPIDLI
jgi:hypothetical protein